MADVIAKVTSIIGGDATVRGADGIERALEVGADIRAGDVVIASGGVVNLEFNDGTPLELTGAEEVTMTEELARTTPPAPEASAVDGASVDQILAAIEAGDDLDALLEATAAGAGVGGGEGGGRNLVMLSRVGEPVDPVGYAFGRFAAGPPAADVQLDAAGLVDVAEVTPGPTFTPPGPPPATPPVTPPPPPPPPPESEALGIRETTTETSKVFAFDPDVGSKETTVKVEKFFDFDPDQPEKMPGISHIVYRYVNEGGEEYFIKIDNFPSGYDDKEANGDLVKNLADDLDGPDGYEWTGSVIFAGNKYYFVDTDGNLSGPMDRTGNGASNPPPGWPKPNEIDEVEQASDSDFKDSLDGYEPSTEGQGTITVTTVTTTTIQYYDSNGDPVDDPIVDEETTTETSKGTLEEYNDLVEGYGGPEESEPVIEEFEVDEGLITVTTTVKTTTQYYDAEGDQVGVPIVVEEDPETDSFPGTQDAFEALVPEDAIANEDGTFSTEETDTVYEVVEVEGDDDNLFDDNPDNDVVVDVNDDGVIDENDQFESLNDAKDFIAPEGGEETG